MSRSSHIPSTGRRLAILTQTEVEQRQEVHRMNILQVKEFELNNKK